MELLEFNNERLFNHKEIVTLNKDSFIRCGVYFLIKDNTVVYIGQSINIVRRIKEHKGKDFDRVVFIEQVEKYMDFLESFYIHQLNPTLNTTSRAPWDWKRCSHFLDSEDSYAKDLFWGNLIQHMA